MNSTVLIRTHCQDRWCELWEREIDRRQFDRFVPVSRMTTKHTMRMAKLLGVAGEFHTMTWRRQVDDFFGDARTSAMGEE